MTTELRIEVTHPGLVTTIQDPGRRGLAFYAIPASGWLDPQAATLANRLVGNAPEAPLLECNLLPVGLRFRGAGQIALTGAAMAWRINDLRVQRNLAHVVRPGDVLGGHATANGARAYIAIAGTMRCDRAHGSAATDLSTGIGGLAGRRLERGDALSIATGADPPPATARARPPDYGAINSIRFQPGPDWRLLNAENRRRLEIGTFRLGSESNRMGARLEGSRLTINRIDMTSLPVIPGVVQLPPSGHPIVVLRDGQTTGGYPRIAIIPESELGRFSQLRPGQPFRFALAE